MIYINLMLKLLVLRDIIYSFLMISIFKPLHYMSLIAGTPKAAILSHNGIINNGYSVGIRNELDTGHKKICVQV